MTEAERIGTIWGQLIGAVLLTYFLTRAVNYVAKKKTTPTRAALIAFFIVAGISLMITSLTSGIGIGFLLYIPCLVMWLIIDIVRAKKSQNIKSSTTAIKPKNDDKKSSNLGWLQWILWWQIDQNELRREIAEYQTLKITRSARGISLLFLILSSVITAIGAVFFSLPPAASFVSIFICLLLGYFINKGHQWAMIGAMLFWSWDKGWQIYEKLQSGSIPGSIWFGLIWWGLYMHAFYLAFRVERAMNKELKNKTFKVTTPRASSLDELDKLAELKNKGIITEEEFNAKKKQILALGEEK